MDYVIAIPSLNRNEYIENKTLKCLRDAGITKDKIFIFVADQDQHLIYQSVDPDLYNQMIIGVLGIVPQRQFISDYFEEGKYIIHMDDDLEEIDLSLTDHTSLDNFFNYAFKDCVEKKSFIWGVYPVYNPFFRKARMNTTYLSYICGILFGTVNRHHQTDLELTISPNHNGNKEDVERSILFFLKDGVVVRHNRVGVKTKYYNLIGGLGTKKQRLTHMLNASIELFDRYGVMSRIKTRKDGLTELVLNYRYKSPLKIEFDIEDSLVV